VYITHKGVKAPEGSLTQVRHDIDSSVDFAVFAGDKLFGLKGGI
jgi:hypothetical protein